MDMLIIGVIGAAWIAVARHRSRAAATCREAQPEFGIGYPGGVAIGRHAIARPLSADDYPASSPGYEDLPPPHSIRP